MSHLIFTFTDDRLLINIADKDNPKPYLFYSIWNADGTYTQSKNKNIDTCYIPTWGCTKSHIIDCFKDNFKTMVEALPDREPRNAFLFVKYTNSDLVQIGTALIAGHGPTPHKYLTNFCQKIIKLRGFW